MTIKKLTGTMIAAKIPKALIGLISDKEFARKATAVVLEVTAMARKERLKAYASLLFSSLAIMGINSLCLQASQKTNMSSAAMPRIMKMVS